ncbi:DUF547 domain-containing protein [Hyphomonas pacifica]|uniref:DUF547 domain-containing protein n=1 Tax=Hyphomonas pacifica TaxID=1280941 RepID=UPI000DC04CF9|nr:DUF547 domain-containing protein [Hyphomonas pacifica]RAN34203.1 hypothetical protein HY11_15485 [Hyphomonas pacifica]
MTRPILTFAKVLFIGCVLALGASLPASAQHAQWTRLLSDYVEQGEDGVNRVDYAALKANQADRAELDVYIARFAEMDLSGRDDATFAAWANLYNAVTMRYIVQQYPLGSIRDGYVFGGPWKKIKVTADGREISLDGIEHDVLRPRFQDPRVHYAINCAAWSCPNLQPVAWKGDTLDRDLDAAARAYINHPRGVHAGPRGLTVSTIYDWFEDDFGGSKAAVMQHLLDYAEPDLADAIRQTPRIRGYEYDWSLNEVRQETKR